MNLKETVAVLDRLIGRYVAVDIWGHPDGALVATLVGTLSTIDTLTIEMSSEIASADEARVYGVGTLETNFSLWPRTFRKAVQLNEAHGVRIETSDVTLEVRETYRWD